MIEVLNRTAESKGLRLSRTNIDHLECKFHDVMSEAGVE